MPDWDWEWYEADSDTEDVSLLLSKRSQQLALSALNKMDKRASWLEVDDATWDNIEAALAEAYEELIDEQDVIIQGTFGGIRARRTTNQNMGSPVSTWNKVDFDTVEYETPDHTPEALPIDYITAPTNGLYLIGGQVVWAANASTTMRFSRIMLDSTTPIALTGNAVASLAIYHNIQTIKNLTEGQTITLECFTSVSNLTITPVAEYAVVLYMERLR